AFTIAPGGALAGRRTWASLDEQVYPDGICLDAEGAIWVASPLTNEAIRVREGGAVTDRVAADRHVIACMLGGVERRTLFVLGSTCLSSRESRSRGGWPSRSRPSGQDPRSHRSDVLPGDHDGGS